MELRQQDKLAFRQRKNGRAQVVELDQQDRQIPEGVGREDQGVWSLGAWLVKARMMPSPGAGLLELLCGP